MRVLLVDDSDIYRSTLELLLGAEPDVEVVATAADGAEAIEAMTRTEVDLVVLDYRLPGMDGARVTAELIARGHEAAIVCLTAAATADEQATVLAAGAAAVVEKGDMSALLAALRDASRRV